MAAWPSNPRLIGTRIPRIDGLGKASGRTRYPSDVHPEGMLFGVMLYSPYAHAKVKSIDRRGPYLVGNLDNGELLLIELGEKGSLEKVAPRSTPPKGTLVTFSFTQGGQIRLVDPSGTSHAFVAAADAVAEEVPELAASGLDPVADAVSWTTFARSLLGRNLKLKALLMDPEVVAGIGPSSKVSTTSLSASGSVVGKCFSPTRGVVAASTVITRDVPSAPGFAQSAACAVVADVRATTAAT